MGSVFGSFAGSGHAKSIWFREEGHVSIRTEVSAKGKSIFIMGIDKQPHQCCKMYILGIFGIFFQKTLSLLRKFGR